MEKDIKGIVAENLIALRKSRNLTQADVAKRLNYSDKAVSKWERADSLPDISILCALAEMYGVSLDFLASENSEEKIAATKKPTYSVLGDRIAVSALTVACVFLVAALVFVYVFLNASSALGWIAFLWAVPVSCATLVYFNYIWYKNILFSLILKSAILWTILACVCLQFLSYNLWLIFILGIPAQIIIVLASNLSRRIKSRSFEKVENKEPKNANALDADKATSEDNH